MGRLAFLFAGQGAQTVGMGADILEEFGDVANKVYDEAERVTRNENKKYIV